MAPSSGSHFVQPIARQHVAPCTVHHILLAVCASQNHCGDLFGGHYTATVLDEESGKWYDFDDSSVTEVGVATLVLR